MKEFVQCCIQKPWRKSQHSLVHYKYFGKDLGIFSFCKYLSVWQWKWKETMALPQLQFEQHNVNRFSRIILYALWLLPHVKSGVKFHRNALSNIEVISVIKSFLIIKIKNKRKQLLRNSRVNQLNKPKSFSQPALIGFWQDGIDFVPTPPTSRTN